MNVPEPSRNCVPDDRNILLFFYWTGNFMRIDMSDSVRPCDDRKKGGIKSGQAFDTLRTRPATVQRQRQIPRIFLDLKTSTTRWMNYFHNNITDNGGESHMGQQQQQHRSGEEHAKENIRFARDKMGFFQHPSAAIEGIFAALPLSRGDREGRRNNASWIQDYGERISVERGEHARGMPSHRDSPSPVRRLTSIQS